MGKLSVFLIVVIVLGIILFVSFYLRQKKAHEKQLNEILQCLDRAIAGNQQPVQYNETLDAAITDRLNRFVTMTQMSRENANQDRNNIQALISDISHQVKTPLTNIMLYSGLLRERIVSDEEKMMIQKIQQQTEKLDFFMTELVRSSYLETEMILVNPAKHAIDNLIAESCQAVEVQSLKKSIDFKIHECGKSGIFDRKWTKEALTNILDNAIKYSPTQSTIEIETLFYESFFCIQIKDEGIGISEEEQGLIFQRFYRSKEVLEERGLGIGLYLVREIISRQNGYVKVTSTLGKGSIFSVFLPCE